MFWWFKVLSRWISLKNFSNSSGFLVKFRSFTWFHATSIPSYSSKKKKKTKREDECDYTVFEAPLPSTSSYLPYLPEGSTSTNSEQSSAKLSSPFMAPFWARDVGVCGDDRRRKDWYFFFFFKKREYEETSGFFIRCPPSSDTAERQPVRACPSS